MKKLIISFCFIIALATPVIAQDTATDSSQIDPNTIKENIKKRIQQVVQNTKADTIQKKTAYLGVINSITPNSITIEDAGGGTKQASTSGFTSYIDTSSKKTLKREDASIGDYVAALGFIGKDTEVLDARRFLILRSPPKNPEKTSFYGSISQIDLKKNRLYLTNNYSSQSRIFSLSAKTDSFLTNPNGLTNKSIELKDIALNQSALVIFKPTGSTESAIPAEIILVKNQ